MVVAKKESSNGQLQQENHNFPPWMYFSNDTQSCQCGPTLHKTISCVKDGNRSEVGVFFQFCMTQNNEHTKVVVGACPYNRGGGRYQSVKTYRSLPRNVTQLDRYMRGLTARTGQLCGECMEDCSLPVYSYYPQCITCTGDTNNWAKYLAVSLLPTTAFFTGALVFRFRATSPPQLCSCGVAVEALHRMLSSLSKAVEHSKLACGCLCNFPPLLVFKCLVRYSNANFLMGYREHNAASCTLL